MIARDIVITALYYRFIADLLYHTGLADHI